MSFDELLTSLQKCIINGEQEPDNVFQGLRQFYEKLLESQRTNVKRSREQCLEEAVRLLKRVSSSQLLSLDESLLLLIIQVLIALQLKTVGISSACGKIDQMLQQLTNLNQQMVYREIENCLISIFQKDQLTLKDLQTGWYTNCNTTGLDVVAMTRLKSNLYVFIDLLNDIACMFLEDSVVGREVWQDFCLPLMQKVAELFTVILEEEPLRDGPVCYAAVKLCLQIFQLLADQVSSVVWSKVEGSQVAQNLLQALVDVIYGQCCNRDTCLLAGTAVAMLLNTSQSEAAGHAAWGLLQISHQECSILTVGGLQVNCRSMVRKELAVLAIIRGVLTCCRAHVLFSSETQKTCLLVDGLFSIIVSLCEKKLDCHYFVFDVLTIWLKKVKECLADIKEITGDRLLSERSSLQQQLIQIITTNADSPVEGVSELARGAFALLLDIYQRDCDLSGDAEKALYSLLLIRIASLPWENKAKYYQLCALLPYLGIDKVLQRCPETPNHLLKCLSTNHLSPCGSELYKCLIQQQNLDLQSHGEGYLADEWSKHWRPLLIEALTSDVTILQNNSATHLLPCTFRLIPSAVEPLLEALDPRSPGHLYAWACIVSSYRATTGRSPWTLQEGAALQILQLALGSADDKVRLAAFSLFCCSPKTKDCPTHGELQLMRSFIPQNLNCDSSSFRQHFQSGVRQFLVRIRDCCLSFVKMQNCKKEANANKPEAPDLLKRGTEFIDWLGELPYCHLAPGHSYQRKKTALLMLTAVLETCTDTWSPEKKKGQPPVNMGCLIDYVTANGLWDFFNRSKLLVLISCLEDSTNEIRELSASLLLRFFPKTFSRDVVTALLTRTKRLLCSPRVQEAQTAALMTKVLHLIPADDHIDLVRFLLKELEEHYHTAKSDMMLAARTKPIHGVLCALQRCLFDSPDNMRDKFNFSLTGAFLQLLENISQLLLGVLYGDQDGGANDQDVAPSFCDMGKAITTLIGQDSDSGQEDPEECVLLSEEHSLVLTCCWVSLKEIGLFLGSLVERVLSQREVCNQIFTKTELKRASRIFWNILLKCRQWGAVEGCSIGFTKFCTSLKWSDDPELKEIPADMLRQVLQVIASPRSTSVTRRAAGLPMLILSVLSAEDASKGRPLLAHSVEFLLDTAKAPLPVKWDETLDLPQVCAVHTLQALVRSTALGSAVLQFAPTVAILSLTLLSSPCWAMRNAALQLYSSLCSRMLGHCPSGEDDKRAQNRMSSTAFFCHYCALQPFLLAELREAANILQDQTNAAQLYLKPSLFPILTLLAQLQPGVQDSTQSWADFSPHLVNLSASPIYNVRVMASRALVAITPPSEMMNILSMLVGQLPSAKQRYSHNWMHGRLLLIKALLSRAICTHSQMHKMNETVIGLEASLWLATEAECCPLLKMAYVEMIQNLKQYCSEYFLSRLNKALTDELQKPLQAQHIQIGTSSFHQTAVHFLCTEPLWAGLIWGQFCTLSLDVKLILVKWTADGCTSQQNTELIHRLLRENLRSALLSDHVEYRHMYLAAFVKQAASSNVLQQPPVKTSLEEPAQAECLELLLEDVEAQRGGPEFLSQALCAASLLLRHCSCLSTLDRWCQLLESHCSPHAPEVLRAACAEALILAAATFLSRNFSQECPAVTIRLVNTCLYLLQDQSVHVRARATYFVSLLKHDASGAQGSVYVMQVNKALPFLLDLILDQTQDSGTVDLLLSHLPQSDLVSVKRRALQNKCVALYEQDEVNVFAEPAVMCAHVLPCLLQAADRCGRSPALAQRLDSWAKECGPQVLDELRVCEELLTGEMSTWLTLLADPHFHSALCGLSTQAALLVRLAKSSPGPSDVCDPSVLQRRVGDVYAALRENGVHFPPALSRVAVGGASE